jgi:hypothetical protein
MEQASMAVTVSTLFLDLIAVLVVLFLVQVGV